MAEDLKVTAEKEAGFILREARLKAEDMLRQASRRAVEIQEEIQQFKKQRIEIESSIRALLDYHTKILELGEEEARKADEELDKLKFFTKK